jgi:hypothetical protein
MSEHYANVGLGLIKAEFAVEMMLLNLARRVSIRVEKSSCTRCPPPESTRRRAGMTSKAGSQSRKHQMIGMLNCLQLRRPLNPRSHWYTRWSYF